MRSFAVLLILVTVSQAAFLPTILRAPSHDSAIIRSDRLGGNFAYSVQESHAYAAVNPVITNMRTPVAVSYSAPVIHAPAVHLPHPAVHIKEVEIPQVEVKTVEIPKFKIRTVPAAGFSYAHGLPLTYAGFPALTHAAAPFNFFEVKTVEEKKSE